MIDDDRPVEEQDFQRVEDMTKALNKMVKPITCPICQCQVQVMGVPDRTTGEMVFTTTQVRSSSVEHCPRCGNGKKQVEARLIEEAKHAERKGS